MKRILVMIVVMVILLSGFQVDCYSFGNSVEVMYEEGMEFFEKEDYDRAFARFQISGEVRGYAPAQNMLGVCYRDGLGTERDFEKAEEYFRLSADQGYTPAQENVASLSARDVPEETVESTISTDPVSTQVSAEEKKAVIPWAETVRVGDTVKFGSYEQDNNLTNGKETIEWLVLDIQEGKALLLSKYGLDCQQYHNTITSSITWEECSLRNWLNNIFLSTAFSPDEEEKILTTTVTATNNSRFKTSYPGNDTTDQVFLLSDKEVDQYFLSDNERKCEPTAYAQAQGAQVSGSGICWWWMRTPGRINSNAIYVYPDGSVKYYGGSVNDSFTIRPAVWVTLGQESVQIEEYGQSAEPAPVSSFSQPPVSSKEPVVAQTIEPFLHWARTVKVGDYVEFGSYEEDNDLSNGKEPIEWIVLEVKDDEALLLSTKALECRPYTNESSDQITWETCSMREWLNNNFLMEAFSEQEQERILLSEVNADKNPSFSTDPGKTTNDKIFILSLFETRQYFSSDSERQCCPTVYCGTRSPVTYQNGNCWWWLRTPGSISSFAVAVDMNGTIKIDGMRANNPDHVMVRPALRVSLKSGDA